MASPASCAPLVLRRASSESASPLTKGLQTFRGCVQYVTGKDEAKILASDGVLLGSVGNIADSFDYQRGLNPRCSKPVGHIALSFKPEDKEKLTERTKFEIQNAVKNALQASRTWPQFTDGLKRQGVEVEFKRRRGCDDLIEGITFIKDGVRFKGSQIGRQYTYAKLSDII